MVKKSLVRFEDIAQRLVEGTLSRWLGGHVSVASVAAECARALERDQRDGVAPNAFQVTLAPADLAALGQDSADSVLSQAIAEQVADHARRLGLRLTTAPQIELITDTALKRHQLRVAARHVAPTDGTRTFVDEAREGAAIMGAVAALDAFLVVGGQHHFPLSKPIVNLGRHMDNDVVVSRSTVSRRHAQIRWRFGRFILYDLGSRGGTFVNNQRVSECVLHAGDVITLSDASLLYAEGYADTRRAGTLRAEDDGQTAVMNPLAPPPTAD